MLAEIFMMRLEAAKGAVRDALPSSTSPFVSFTPDHRLAFKESQKGLSGVVPEEPMAQKHYTLERDSPR
jgi:hypothetical protein